MYHGKVYSQNDYRESQSPNRRVDTNSNDYISFLYYNFAAEVIKERRPRQLNTIKAEHQD